MKNINFTIFAGGSGNSRLIEILSKIKDINLNVIVNCYDDGKSTGRLRSLVDGMLGPSDIRKNISSLLDKNDFYEKKLKYIIDYRFKKIRPKKIINIIKKNNFELNKTINSLPKKIYERIFYYLIHFQKSTKKNSEEFDLSLGNIIFSGIYLNTKNFNKSVEIFSTLFNKKNQVHNITNGENLYLCAIRNNGEIIKNEEEIVSKPGILIEDIYLLKKKLSNKYLTYLSKLEKNLKKKKLNRLSKIPNINRSVSKILKKSNIIIYGPGTIHSSLLPSYLTKNLALSIVKSKACKILITNIGKDKDMLFEDTDNIIKKTFFYLNLKDKYNINKLKLIDYYFVNKIDKDNINNKFLNNYLELKSLPKKNVKYIDWEEEKGKHNPIILLKEIISVYSKKKIIDLNDYSNISIVVPCLNERKTIKKICTNLKKLNIIYKGVSLSKEIIVVDANSTDNSDKILKKVNEIRYFKIKNLGRGHSIRYGINKSKGDIVVIFPSDNEYQVDEIQKIIEPILSKHTDITFGSRAIKCTNLSEQISKIYKKNYFNYVISKYGGMILSIFSLLFFNRYISDPLTTFKAFRKQTWRNLNLNSNGVNLEMEIIAKISRTPNYILEIPVNYKPRSKEEGKKITILDGISCIISIIKFKFFR